MVAKSIALSCPECGTEYSIISNQWESIQFCPFCGNEYLKSYADMDRDGEFEEYDEEDDEEDDSGIE